MKNTIENKARFFALYWSQEVVSHEGYNGETSVVDWHKVEKNIEGDYFLLLKPLSQISEKDLKNIDFRFNVPVKDVEIKFNDDLHWRAEYNNDGRVVTGYLLPKHIDYLRLKGYAIPWNGLTVEEMIEFGWIKIKESNCNHDIKHQGKNKEGFEICKKCDTKL